MKKGPILYYKEFRHKHSLFVVFVNVFQSPNQDSHRSSNDNLVYLLHQTTWKYFHLKNMYPPHKTAVDDQDNLRSITELARIKFERMVFKFLKILS